MQQYLHIDDDTFIFYLTEQETGYKDHTKLIEIYTQTHMDKWEEGLKHQGYGVYVERPDKELPIPLVMEMMLGDWELVKEEDLEPCPVIDWETARRYVTDDSDHPPATPPKGETALGFGDKEHKPLITLKDWYCEDCEVTVKANKCCMYCGNENIS